MEQGIVKIENLIFLLVMFENSMKHSGKRFSLNKPNVILTRVIFTVTLLFLFLQPKNT